MVESFEERDALHVLRLFQRVRDKIRTHDAEAQIDALAEQSPHLRVDGGDGVGGDWQIAGGRQLDDAAIDQDFGARDQRGVARRLQLLLERDERRQAAFEHRRRFVAGRAVHAQRLQREPAVTV